MSALVTKRGPVSSGRLAGISMWWPRAQIGRAQDLLRLPLLQGRLVCIGSGGPATVDQSVGMLTEIQGAPAPGGDLPLKTLRRRVVESLEVHRLQRVAGGASPRRRKNTKKEKNTKKKQTDKVACVLTLERPGWERDFVCPISKISPRNLSCAGKKRVLFDLRDSVVEYEVEHLEEGLTRQMFDKVDGPSGLPGLILHNSKFSDLRLIPGLVLVPIILEAHSLLSFGILLDLFVRQLLRDQN